MIKSIYLTYITVVLLLGTTASFVEAPTFTKTIYGHGVASWYGAWHHGREMANGSMFDMYKFTVAHKTLPLGTLLRIRNLVNGREVVARVTDRGPYIEGRELDLSYAVAKKLGFVENGITKVMFRKEKPI